MGSSYHQFCPVAKAMELLDQRWTMLVVRELLTGSGHFNELRRGLPTMSPTLLSARLQQLTRAGVVARSDDGRYALTPVGRELEPVVMALAAWGVRWIGELGDEDLDPRLLLWDMHRHVDSETVPTGRTVVAFDFPDVPGRSRHWWLVLTPDEVDVCDVDPGYPLSVTVIAELRRLTEVWRGDVSWAAALRSGTVRLEGPAPLRRALPRWFRLPDFATVSRPT